MTRVTGATDNHLQEASQSGWSVARGCPCDDHLQEAGPSEWSFARGRSLWMNNNNNKTTTTATTTTTTTPPPTTTTTTTGLQGWPGETGQNQQPILLFASKLQLVNWLYTEDLIVSKILSIGFFISASSMCLYEPNLLPTTYDNQSHPIHPSHP